MMHPLILVILLQLFSPVKVITLPEGDLQWSTTRPESARFCVPASFSTKEGKVIDKYKYVASLTKDTFVLTTNHKARNSFSQFVLVKGGEAFRFRDTRKFVRRALCKKDGKTFIIQSRFRVTLGQFAEDCAEYSTDAINLDMGSYGYGRCGRRILAPWAIFWKNRQTNWLYIE